MQFTRQDETEADYLGVQYLYAAGYDPNGAIGIFEKLESLERRQPGTVARIYASHPMDAARIARTEREIGKILPARREYVVSTSEYAAIRERVIGSSPNKLDGEAARPRLVRREPEAGPEPERPDGPAVRRRDLVD
jgi:predicted Zn-dependent protease